MVVPISPPASEEMPAEFSVLADLMFLREELRKRLSGGWLDADTMRVVIVGYLAVLAAIAEQESQGAATGAGDGQSERG